MSDEVFPLDVLDGLDIEIARVEIWDTKVFGSESGKETRTSRWSVPRYRFTLTPNVLRREGYTPGQADEIAILSGFFSRHRGRFDSFLLDDEFDNPEVPTRRRVRFVDDELNLSKIDALLVRGEKVEIISLK